MTERSLEDYHHERQALDAAHAQNEAGRDAFIALAHTALFAASISFVSDVTPVAEAIFKPALVLGWASSVTGLLALTLSFGASRRAIDARRAALNETDPPRSSRWCEALNTIALWSFPVSLLCLFSFVTANVVYPDVRQAKPTASVSPKGRNPAAASAHVHYTDASKRSNPASTCASASATAPATAARKEVGGGDE